MTAQRSRRDPRVLSKMLQQALQEGRREAAWTLAKELLAISPRDINARFALGTLAYQERDFAGAAELLQSVVEEAPHFISARLNLGSALQELGRLPEAEAQYQAILESNPNHPMALNNLGRLHHACGDLIEARGYLERSLAVDESHWLPWFNLGSVLSALGESEQAQRCYLSALAKHPAPEVYAALVSSFKKSGAFAKALQMAHESLEKCGITDATLSNLGTLIEACEWKKVAEILPHLMDLIFSGSCRTPYIQGALLSLNTRPDVDPETRLRVHQQWGRQIRRNVTPFVHHPKSLSLPEKLRIGYVSPDFREHSVGLFLQHVLPAHDRDRFEIVCYSRAREEDEMTRSFRDSGCRYVDASRLTMQALAQHIEADGIHVLVDLAGHTEDSALEAFAWRPAPVQITWLGYPATTGLEEMDYRITDRYADGPDTEGYYTEELLYLPQSFLCFGAFQERPRRETPPCTDKGYITFGSFNDTRKLTPEVVRVWSAILSRVPNSRLVIKARLAGEVVVQAHVREEFARHGIEAERVEMRGFMASREAHLDSYDEIDIALDTFPYNGTTTTCEALWMGVPVVTLVGRVHAQRVGYSILKNIGVEETIAETEEAYVEQAVALARDWWRLGELRREVASAIRGSILCDPERFTRQLEELYLEAWRRKVGDSEEGARESRKDEASSEYYYLKELDLYVPATGRAPSRCNAVIRLSQEQQDALRDEGRLLPELPAVIEAPQVQPGAWVERLQNLPYARRLSSQWLAWMEREQASAPWLLHQQALDCHAQSFVQPPAGRYRFCLYAYRILFQLLSRHATPARLQTFIRLALAVGEYETASKALAEMRKLLDQGDMDLSEPFLTVTPELESVDPGEDWTAWLCKGLTNVQVILPSTSPNHIEYVGDGPGNGNRENMPAARHIRMLHNLARTGGTLISKCLGCMENVVLLSEIHPKASELFNPISQAIDWSGLFDGEDSRELRSKRLNFVQQIDLIEERCRERGKYLVIRDWSHYDFMAVPFTTNPTYEFTTANVLQYSGLFVLSRMAIVRHPIDQWLSLMRLSVLKGRLDLRDFLQGYRRYAEFCCKMDFLRYEDFISRPEESMKSLCNVLDIPYDGEFINKWHLNRCVTGDVDSERGGYEIKKMPRREISEELMKRFEHDRDYQAILDMLGYEHPE